MGLWSSAREFPLGAGFARMLQSSSSIHQRRLSNTHLNDLQGSELEWRVGEEDFRLPGSSYDELVKIIRAYGNFDSEQPLPAIATVAGLHVSSLSRNNAFLAAVGVIEGGQRKVITQTGKRLALALEHNIAEDISKGWRDLIVTHQFFLKLLAAVRIRRGMDEATLQSHVAYSAGQKKSPNVVTGAAALVEIMKIAGLVREENGKLVAADESVTGKQDGNATATDNEAVSPAGDVTATRPSPSPRVQHGTQVNVTIQLNIQCAPNQIDEVSSKLRGLIEQVTKTGSSDS